MDKGALPKWLVIGGFIGSHVVGTLLACGYEVTALDNFGLLDEVNVSTSNKKLKCIGKDSVTAREKD